MKRLYLIVMMCSGKSFEIAYEWADRQRRDEDCSDIEEVINNGGAVRIVPPTLSPSSGRSPLVKVTSHLLNGEQIESVTCREDV